MIIVFAYDFYRILEEGMNVVRRLKPDGKEYRSDRLCCLFVALSIAVGFSQRKK